MSSVCWGDLVEAAAIGLIWWLWPGLRLSGTAGTRSRCSASTPFPNVPETFRAGVLPRKPAHETMGRTSPRSTTRSSSGRISAGHGERGVNRLRHAGSRLASRATSWGSSSASSSAASGKLRPRRLSGTQSGVPSRVTTPSPDPSSSWTSRSSTPCQRSPSDDLVVLGQVAVMVVIGEPVEGRRRPCHRQGRRAPPASQAASVACAIDQFFEPPARDRRPLRGGIPGPQPRTGTEHVGVEDRCDACGLAALDVAAHRGEPRREPADRGSGPARWRGPGGGPPRRGLRAVVTTRHQRWPWAEEPAQRLGGGGAWPTARWCRLRRSVT